MAFSLDQLLHSAQSQVQNVVNSFTQPHVNHNPMQNIGQNIGNAITSLPYNAATQANNHLPVGALKINLTQAQAQDKADYAQYQKASPVKKLGIDTFQGDMSGAPPSKTSSAAMVPYVYNTAPAPQSNPYLENLKQQVINSSNATPQAKAYWAKIPISTLPKLPDSSVEGVSHGVPNAYGSAAHPYIAINPNLSKPELNHVMQHELLHETPRLVPTDLFHPENKPIVDQFVQQWGPQYMQHPGALVEEMFAEQQLPPAYYWHVFKGVNPNATKKDFVAALKSWFVNRVNTPAMPRPTPTPMPGGIPGTLVPNSGQ